MADVHLRLNPEQATALLEFLEQHVRDPAAPQRTSVAEAQRMVTIWSLRDALRAAGISPRRHATGVCDDES